MNTAELISQALNADSNEYKRLVEESTRLLSSEKGRIGSLTVEGRLVKMEPSGEAVVVGDLHGDLQSLTHILKRSNFLEKASTNTGVFLIFLGDYVDRGPNSPEVLYVVLKLKQLFPTNIVLLRGNHEGPDDLMPYPHDLPQELNSRFASEGASIYRDVRKLFPYLHNAVIVRGLCVMVHGGVPSHATSIEDLKFAHLKHPKESHLEEMLWSDPIDSEKGTTASPRGAGRLFGEDITKQFLEALNVRFLIRGHEPAQNGYSVSHGGKILTLFSRKGSPYFNSSAAYLLLNLSSTPKSANELGPSLHKF